jgi:hypothetical protein
MKELILNTLPHNHPFRNKPLAGMYSRNEGTKNWIEITPAYGIAKATFNDLNLNSWAKTEFMCKEELEGK